MLFQSRRRPLSRFGPILTLVLAALLLLVAALLAFSSASASSHREAPLISQDPFADNTDTYVFIPPHEPDNIVLVGSWIPFEGPEGGPNYWEWGKDVAYYIYVDNNGDAVADVTYELTSKTVVGNPDTFLYNTDTIDALGDSAWNRRQYITVTESFEGGSTNVLVDGELTSPVNIGEKSTPDYAGLEQDAIHTYTDNGQEIKIFAGQTDDPFFVDLQVFDLLTLRGQPPPIGYEQYNQPIDSLSGFNVHSLVLEIPIERLVSGDEPVLGVWATSKRAPMTVLPAESNSPQTHDYVQVSRLGMPLVNEVVLPMGLKDVFNTLSPSDDLGVYGLLQESVEDPEVGNLLCALYGVPLPADSDDDCDTEYTAGTPRTGRGDIFDIFLTGMVLENEFTINTAGGPVTLDPGFNVNRPDGVVPAEMIRINTTIKGDLCSPTPSRLGILGGDACGFPNGRRLADDVVEIELLAVAGAAYEVLDDRDASFSFDPAFIDVLTDRVDTNDMSFRHEFPYLALAQSGQAHQHENAFAPVYAPIITASAQWLSIGILAIIPIAMISDRIRQRRSKRE